MSNDVTVEALYWANRAEDVRGEARNMKDPVARECMGLFAQEYERLARGKQQILERRKAALDSSEERVVPPKSVAQERQSGASEERAGTAAELSKGTREFLDRLPWPNGRGRGGG
jgi:hypothetical protein